MTADLSPFAGARDPRWMDQPPQGAAEGRPVRLTDDQRRPSGPHLRPGHQVDGGIPRTREGLGGARRPGGLPGPNANASAERFVRSSSRRTTTGAEPSGSLLAGAPGLPRLRVFVLFGFELRDQFLVGRA